MALGRIQGNTVLDTNGNPISGAVIRFYEVGTLTPKTIYSDIAQSISLGTSIITDASGRFTLPYTSNPFKIRVETSATDSTLIYEQDHIGQDVADVNTQTAGLLTIANVQNSVGTFATTGGSSNAYTVTLSQALSSYQTGQFIKFKANHTNTGAATINVSNVGVVALQGNLGTDLVAGDIVVDGVYSAIYDGGVWKLTNSQGTNQSTIQVNTVNELTADNGVTVDGVLLKDNDVTATDATLSGNLQAATATITSDLNTDDITERTSGHGVEIDGVLLKDGNVSLGNDGNISSIGSVIVNIDTDDDETDTTFSVRDAGANTVFQVTDDGYAVIRRSVGAEILAIFDDGAASSSDANPLFAFRYAATSGGSSTRLGYINFNTNTLSVVNETATGNINLVAGAGGNVLIGSNTAWHAGNDGAGSGLDADLLDGQEGSYYRNASNINSGTIADTYLPATITKDTSGTHSGNVTGTVNGVAVANFWHSGNDGAGSGLDADLLDGQHGSYYTDASNLSSGTLPAARVSGGTYTVTKITSSGGEIGLSGDGTQDYIKFVDATDTLTGYENGVAGAMDIHFGDATLASATIAGVNVRDAAILNTGTLPDARLSATVDSRLAAVWINFDGTGTPSINSDYNVSSITDNGVGDYTINFTSSLSNTNYAVVATGSNVGTGNIIHVRVQSKATGSLRILVSGFDGNVFVNSDADDINVAIYET